MSYISEVFRRANIQQIREFLLHGIENTDLTSDAYEVRLKEANRQITSEIKKVVSDGNKADEAEGIIFSSIGEIIQVYMEVGIQCGVMLCNDLLNLCGNRPA